MSPWRVRVLVMGGGSVGALARHLVVSGLEATGSWPVGTLAVNATGSAVLGWLIGRVDRGAPSWLIPLAGAGVLGAFTTFGAFVVQILEDPLAGIAYALVSVGAGLLGALGGMRLAGRPYR